MWLHVPLSTVSQFAPESACSTKAFRRRCIISASNIAPFVMLSGTATQRPLSWHGWKARPWIKLLYGTISRPSLAGRSAGVFIASLPVSRVRIFQSPDAAKGLTEVEAGFSSTSSILQTIAVRRSCFWRTSQASILPQPPLFTKPKSSLNGRPPESWASWPTVGGMRNGCVYERPRLALRTNAIAGSVSHGDAWLTPNCPNGGRSVSAELVESKGATEDGKRTVGLESQTKHWATPMSADDGHKVTAASKIGLIPQVARWPTPRAGTNGSDSGSSQRQQKGPNLGLKDAAKQWPTPHGFQGGNGPDGNEFSTAIRNWSTPKASDSHKGGPNMMGSHGDIPLPNMAANWPTPMSRDWKNGDASQETLDRRSRGLSEIVHSYMRGGGGIMETYLPQGPAIPDGPTSSLSGPNSPRLLAAILIIEWLRQNSRESCDLLFLAETDAPVEPMDEELLNGLLQSFLKKRLNPEFGEWLMGWPIGLTSTEPTACDVSAMELWRSKLQLHMSNLFGDPG